MSHPERRARQGKSDIKQSSEISQPSQGFLPKGSMRFLSGLFMVVSLLAPSDIPQHLSNKLVTTPNNGAVASDSSVDSEQQIPEWKVIIEEGIGAAAATDSKANLYVGGSKYNGKNYDAWIAKYSSEGKPIWQSTYNSPDNLEDTPQNPAERIQGLAVDKNSDVYAVGYQTLKASGRDVWIRKYGSMGEILWNKNVTSNGKYDDEAHSVTLDDQNNVYVMGKVYQNITGYDIWIRKFNPNGAEVWTKTFNTEARLNNAPYYGIDEGFDITIANGFLYGTGIEDNFINGVQGQQTWEELWVSKLDLEGKQIWKSSYDSPDHDHDHGFGVTADDKGNIYVAGRTVRIEPDNNIHGNALIQKYSDDGKLIGSKEFDLKSNQEENARRIIFNEGKLYVVGSRYKKDESLNIFLQTYDLDANLLSEKDYDSGAGYDEGAALALSAKSVFVVGSQSGPKNNSRPDVAINRYNK